VKIDNFFSELKRRNVYKVAVSSPAIGWWLIQIAIQVFPFPEDPRGERSWWVCSGGSAAIPWRAPAVGRCPL
jgi:hypothetical protein